MCNILSFRLLSNHLPPPGCAALIDDIIEVETTVQFDSGDVGKTVSIGAELQYPNSLVSILWGPTSYYVSSIHAAIFGIEVPYWDLSDGSLIVNKIEVYDESYSIMCSLNSSGAGCSVITLSTPTNPATLQIAYIVANPQTPNAGDTVTVTPRLVNVGEYGKARCVIKADDSVILDQCYQDGVTCLNIDTNQEWTPSATFIIPPSGAVITVETYHIDQQTLDWSMDYSESRALAVQVCTVPVASMSVGG